MSGWEIAIVPYTPVNCATFHVLNGWNVWNRWNGWNGWNERLLSRYEYRELSKRGQVSVPSEVRKKLKIGPNTTLEWVVEGNTARVILLPSDPVSAFRGSGKKGMVKRLLKERQRENGF